MDSTSHGTVTHTAGRKVGSSHLWRLASTQYVTRCSQIIQYFSETWFSVVTEISFEYMYIILFNQIINCDLRMY